MKPTPGGDHALGQGHLAIVAGVLYDPSCAIHGCAACSQADQVPDIAVGLADDGSVTVLVPTGDAVCPTVQPLQSETSGASSPGGASRRMTSLTSTSSRSWPGRGFTTVRLLEQLLIQGRHGRGHLPLHDLCSVAPADLVQGRFTTTSGDEVTEDDLPVEPAVREKV